MLLSAISVCGAVKQWCSPPPLISRVLAGPLQLQFGWCFTSENQLLSLTVWLPFKLQLFSCAPGQENQQSGPAVMSFPTAGPHLGVALPKVTMSPSPAVFYVVSLSLVQKLFTQSSVLPQEELISLCVGVDLVCTQEEVRSGFFYITILDQVSHNFDHSEIPDSCLPVLGLEIMAKHFSP